MRKYKHDVWMQSGFQICVIEITGTYRNLRIHFNIIVRIVGLYQEAMIFIRQP